MAHSDQPDSKSDAESVERKSSRKRPYTSPFIQKLNTDSTKSAGTGGTETPTFSAGGS